MLLWNFWSKSTPALPSLLGNILKWDLQDLAQPHVLKVGYKLDKVSLSNCECISFYKGGSRRDSSLGIVTGKSHVKQKVQHRVSHWNSEEYLESCLQVWFWWLFYSEMQIWGCIKEKMDFVAFPTQGFCLQAGNWAAWSSRDWSSQNLCIYLKSKMTSLSSQDTSSTRQIYLFLCPFFSMCYINLKVALGMDCSFLLFR